MIHINGRPGINCRFSKLHLAFMACFALPALAADNSGGLEEIIVTGQKIERSLQDTVTSVAVLTEQKMKDHNITNFYDSINDTANVYTNSEEVFSIRGIDAFNVTGYGGGFLSSVYIDGAQIPQRMIQGGSFSTWDAQQVEILRGPQSTLQGRNALAGAVMLTTKTPNTEWGGDYRLQVGENGEREGAIALGSALIEDELAFRFSAETKESDGLIENTVRNEPSDFKDDQTYRLKFNYTPAALPDFSAQLSIMHVDHSRGVANIEIAEGSDPFDKREVTFNDPREQFFDADLVSLNIKKGITDGWNFESVTTWSEVDSGYDWDVDILPATGSAPMIDTGSVSYYAQNVETLSQEFRLLFNADNVTGLVGAYFYEMENNSGLTGQRSVPLETVGLSNTFLQYAYGLDPATAGLVLSQYATFDPARAETVTDTYINVSSAALFADATWSLNDQWDVFAGFRWDYEKQENDNSASYVISNAGDLPDPANYLGTPYEAIVPLIYGINSFIYDSAAQASQEAQLVDTSFDTVLPKIGATYHINDDVSTSFTYQRGYRSGGVGVNIARANVYQYDPEYTTNYEFSLRSVWLDGDLVANANVFYVDWEDQQVNIQLSTNSYDESVVNSGSSTVQGFELEVDYYVSDSLQIYTSIGQAKSEFTDFVIDIPVSATSSTIYDLTGRSFADAPEWTASLGATYGTGEGWFANLNINYADSNPDSTNPYALGLVEGDADFDLQNESRTLVNLQLGYQWNKVGMYLIGRNILDEEYVTANRVRSPMLGDERQVSLMLRGSF